MKVVVPLAEIVLAQLTTTASGSAIHGAIQRKMCGQGVVRAVIGITLVISSRDTDDIMVIILKNLGS